MTYVPAYFNGIDLEIFLICGSNGFRKYNLQGETIFSNLRNKLVRGQIENACPTSIAQLNKSTEEENSATSTCKEKLSFEIYGIFIPCASFNTCLVGDVQTKRSTVLENSMDWKSSLVKIPKLSGILYSGQVKTMWKLQMMLLHGLHKFWWKDNLRSTLFLILDSRNVWQI